MNSTQIYAITAGGAFLLLFLYRISTILSLWIQDRTLFLILKHLIYPFLLKRNRYFNSQTRWHFALIVFYWLGTAACNIIGVDSLPAASNRAGTLSAIHLIPLLFSDRLSFAANLLGIPINSYNKLHGAMGFMTCVQGTVHVLLFLLRNPFLVRDRLQFYGLLGGIALLTLLLLTCIRVLFFELFTKSHFGLAILLVYAVWRHLALKSNFARLYVVIAVAIFATTFIMRYARLLYRHWSWSQPYATTQVLETQKSNGALCLRVSVRRPWNVRAGQYVYLWIPFCSFWSFFQTHPFAVSWWDQDSEGRGATIYILLKPMHGFSAKLLRHVGSVGLRTWIDGPYGGNQNIGDYGDVLMFASGIGVAAQVPYVKELLRSINDRKARTRSISLVWQLEKESDQEWVREWMDQLLEEDKGHYILRIRLYVVRGFEDTDTSYGTQLDYGKHESIRKFYGKAHLEKIIAKEIADKRGRLLVTTSVERKMEERIQVLVEEQMDKDVRLMHLDFRPREYRGIWAPKMADVEHQGVV